MCQAPPDDHSLPRRNFLKLAGAAAVGLTFSGRASAADAKAPPRPQNVLSSDAALERLIKRNGRYVEGVMARHGFVAERPALVLGQNPFADILRCADSRVAPEFAFDTGRGDLFVCRVAGNFAEANSIASFEYAVAVLGTPLLVVLGHGACGAVDTTIKAVKDGAKFPGHIPSLIDALRPAVQAAMTQPRTDLLNNAIKQNVVLNVEKLKAAGPILSKAVEERKLKIVGGIYL